MGTRTNDLPGAVVDNRELEIPVGTGDSDGVQPKESGPV